MKTESALGVLLCSASLVLARESRRRPLLELAGRLCAAVVVFLATAAIVEHSGMRVIGLSSEWSAAGPMSLQTASSFVLLGLSLVIDRTRWRLLSHVVHFLILALLMLILVVIAGYMFGASDLVGQSPNIRMSPQTLVCMALLAFVRVNRAASHGAFAIMLGPGMGSQVARIMVPSSVVLSYVIIRAGDRLLETGTLTLPYAGAVTATSMAALILIFVLLLAGKINELEAELHGMTLIDDLTGLYNRKGFWLLGEQALRDARRAAEARSVLFLDADGLKQVNDTLGHDHGSELLVDIATLLRDTFRDSDVLGRVGGDEFAVITHGHDGELTSVLRRLDEATEALNRTGNKPYQVNFSVGAVAAHVKSANRLPCC